MRMSHVSEWDKYPACGGLEFEGSIPINDIPDVAGSDVYVDGDNVSVWDEGGRIYIAYECDSELGESYKVPFGSVGVFATNCIIDDQKIVYMPNGV